MTVDFKMTDEDINKLAGAVLEALLPMLEKKLNPEPTRQMTFQEVLEYLPGVSRDNLKKICTEKKLGVKVGSRMVFTNKEIDSLLVEYRGKALI